MAARPIRAQPVRTEPKGKKLYVTVEFARPRWQRWIGADAVCRRAFGLDEYGQEVYAQCDGARTVEEIVRQFAQNHHLSIAEAEVSVTAFLKTLMSKGIVGMAVPRQGSESRPANGGAPAETEEHGTETR
jgi:hypothetical protein